MMVTQVLNCAKEIREFCSTQECIECPFYSNEEECLFMSFAPVDWTERTFKCNSRTTY